jgi:hypothetical protein
MDNRRKHFRYRLPLKGRLVVFGQQMRVHVENLSSGGLRASLDTPLLEGSDVEVELTLDPDVTQTTGNPFHTKGTVVWCVEDVDVGYQVGIRFGKLDAEAKDVLEKMVKTGLSV